MTCILIVSIRSLLAHIHTLFMSATQAENRRTAIPYPGLKRWHTVWYHLIIRILGSIYACIRHSTLWVDVYFDSWRTTQAWFSSIVDYSHKSKPNHTIIHSFTAFRKARFVSAVYATANPPVCLSVPPSVTLRYCIEARERGAMR